MNEYQSLEYQSLERHRWDEIKSSTIALLMLALALLALYSNIVLLALVPLVWMAYKVGKEMGRGEAQRELAQAAAVSSRIRFPDQP